MNVLVWQLPPAGFTADFIVIVFLYASMSAFLTKRSIWFPWRLVLVGGIWGNWTLSDIKNYLTLGLKLLKRVAYIYNGNTVSCGGELTLKSNRVSNSFTD